MLRAILNKSWRQHPTKHQLYGHLPPIMKTIQVRPTRHAGHCWRSRDELISDVLLWTPALWVIQCQSHCCRRTIIIIIIMSCRLHDYPWPSLATSPDHSSPPAGLQGYILYPHIAAVCMFKLVILLLLSHMRRSIGVHLLWARPCSSSSVLHV